MSGEKTKPPVSDEEDERTILTSAPTPIVPDDERTILTSAPQPLPDEDERTILSSAPIPMPGQEGQEDAEEKTILTAAPFGDDERTILTSAPTAMDDEKTILTSAPFGGDDERTILTNAPFGGEERTVIAGQDDPDRTVLMTSPPDGDGDVTRIAVPPAVPVQPTTVVNTLSPVAPAPLTSLEPGTVINNMYTVQERLDQGGMGRVFRGVEKGTGEPVAIKVILPEMAEDTKVADMFRREARTLRQLHHDAIVRYFAYVPPDEQINLHALVMGFIEGTKLSDKLKKEGPLTESEAIKLAARLADGLHQAHKLEIVHRDLSPDNVMLPDGDITKAVLIDFGISRSSQIKDVTIGNEFAGKLKYVSPEQLGAYGGDAQAPSDVYSLGLLMIAMLTGKAASMGDTIVEAVQMRQGVPDLTNLPSRFQDILYRMLQPDPAQRISSMSEVVGQLRLISDGETDFGIGTQTGVNYTQQPVQDRAVPGLQAVPMAMTTTGTQTGMTIAPTSGPTTLPPQPLPAKRGLGAGLLLGALILCGAIGGGAFYLWSETSREVTASETLSPEEAVAAGLQRVEGSREGFLAEALPEGCVFATRRTQGTSAGLLEGYAADTGLLAQIAGQYADSFGTGPELVERQVTADQCAVLDFVRQLQGTKGSRIEIGLDAHVTSRQTGVVGRLHGSDGRQNWLALVDPQGRVFSLMRQLDDPIGDQRRFSFRLPSAAPGVYLVISTASESALIRAGAMQDGEAAGNILPLLLRELATDGQGAADIAYLEMTP